MHAQETFLIIINVENSYATYYILVEKLSFFWKRNIL